MNTLVMNLDTLAVTEYTTPFTGVAGDIECTAAGVYRVGGEKDDGVQFESEVSLGLALAGGARQQRPKHIYVFGTGTCDMTAEVSGTEGTTYEYENLMKHGEAARFKLGPGLRDNYLKFALKSPGSEPFVIDHVEIETLVSGQRRL